MSGIVCALVLTAALSAEPMIVAVDRDLEELVVRVELVAALPEEVETAFASGSRVAIDYPIRVYARRSMFPDRKIWKGVAQSSVAFDAVTGRYLCQMIVNGTTTVSREVDSAVAARRWLVAPPAVEVPIPEARREAFLRIRARAVFSSGTTWLVFPTTVGTGWVEVRLRAPQDGE
jgi:hypothetical protein